MKKVVAKCKYCDTEIQESCQLANFTKEIDGKIYTFCCRICAEQYNPEKKQNRLYFSNYLSISFKKEESLYQTLLLFNVNSFAILSKLKKSTIAGRR